MPPSSSSPTEQPSNAHLSHTSDGPHDYHDHDHVTAWVSSTNHASNLPNTLSSNHDKLTTTTTTANQRRESASVSITSKSSSLSSSSSSASSSLSLSSPTRPPSPQRTPRKTPTSSSSSSTATAKKDPRKNNNTHDDDTTSETMTTTAIATTSDEQAHLEIFQRPKGIRGIYSHPVTQVCLMGFVCFMCPGLFNAVNGLGGAGQLDATTGANANTAVYATFAGTAFFAGSINNTLGSKLTLQLGTVGYCLYIASLLAFDLQPKSHAFVPIAGAILGICAGLLWTAQGSMMLSYPTEQQKGRFIGIFWSIFNLGGVLGAAIAAGLNWHSNAGKVGWGTYVAFLVLTFTGTVLPIFMLDPKDIVRTDGTKIIAPVHPSWKIELMNLYIALRTDPMILLLFPMFFTSNWFYTWQFDDYNAAIFTIRARGLNNVLYWTCQIIGSVAIGLLLDSPKLSRRARAFSGWSVLLVMTMAVHGWAFHYQRQYTRETAALDSGKFDIYTKGYVERLMLYIFCAFLDSMWQTTSYWMMGAMSNDPSKLAHFTGFYKSLQSAGAAGAWRADAVKLPYMNIFFSTWFLLIAGLVFSLPMIHLRVRNFTTFDDEILARLEEQRRQELRAIERAEKAGVEREKIMRV